MSKTTEVPPWLYTVGEQYFALDLINQSREIKLPVDCLTQEQDPKVEEPNTIINWTTERTDER